MKKVNNPLSVIACNAQAELLIREGRSNRNIASIEALLSTQASLRHIAAAALGNTKAAEGFQRADTDENDRINAHKTLATRLTAALEFIETGQFHIGQQKFQVLGDKAEERAQ